MNARIVTKPIIKDGKATKQNNYFIAVQEYKNGERHCSTIAVRKALGLGRPAKQTEAKRLLNKILEESRNGTYVKSSKQLLKNYLEDWLAHHALTVKKSTAVSYSLVVEQYIAPNIGNIALADLSAQDIKNLHKELLARVSNTTARYAHTILKAALESAVREGLVASNVAKTVKPPARVKPEIKWLEWEDAQKLLKESKEERYHPYIKIALSTGLARSEILGLRWKDIDFDNKTLSVRQTFVATDDGNYFQNSAKTAGRSRTLDISQQLVDYLQAHQAQQEIEAEAMGYETELVLCTTNGNPILPSNLHKGLSRIAEKYGIPQFSTHSLRHTYATKMLQEGVHPKIVAERLGHSSVKITLDTYSHVIPRLAMEVAHLTDI